MHARSIQVDGVFIAVGHQPNTQLFEQQLEMRGGYIIVKGGSAGDATATSDPGRVRRRRCRRSRLSPGGHLGRHRLHGGARCGSLPGALEANRTANGAPCTRDRTGRTNADSLQHRANRAAAWNALAGAAQPFLRHEFLLALEESAAQRPRTGWSPRHVLEDEAGRPSARCRCI
jgi:hypothetical protein